MGRGISKVTHQPPCEQQETPFCVRIFAESNSGLVKYFVGWISFNLLKSHLTHSLKNTHWTSLSPGCGSPLPALLETLDHVSVHVYVHMCTTHSSVLPDVSLTCSLECRMHFSESWVFAKVCKNHKNLKYFLPFLDSEP